MREARLVGAVRVAVNGTASEVAAFLRPGRAGTGGDFDSVDDILQRDRR